VSKRPAAVAVTDLGAAPPQKRKASREIIDSLRHRIASGELEKGQRLPTEGDLAAHFGVSQLFVIESVLADILVRLQVDAFSKCSIAFWHKWSLQFANDRRELVAAFRDRDEPRAVAAMMQYLDHQRSRFSHDQVLSEARLSDPEMLRIIRADPRG
jgi:DNA-binding FadR family transcriptional regulator